MSRYPSYRDEIAAEYRESPEHHDPPTRHHCTYCGALLDESDAPGKRPAAPAATNAQGAA